MTSQKIQLNPDELAAFRNFTSQADSRVQGFALGMEEAKKMFLQQLVEARTPAPAPAQEM